MNTDIVLNPHPCDTPGLSSVQFLYALMCDTRMPLMLRIEAANKLMRTGHGNRSFVQAIQNRIGVYPKLRPPKPRPRTTAQLNRSTIRLITRDGARNTS